MAKYMGRRAPAPTLKGRCRDAGIDYKLMCISASHYLLKAGRYTQADVGEFNVRDFINKETANEKGVIRKDCGPIGGLIPPAAKPAEAVEAQKAA